MSKTWAQVAARAGRNDMPYLLFTNFHDMSRAEIRKGIHAAWTMAEWPLAQVPRDLWVKIMRDWAVDGEWDYLHADESWPIDDLPESVTLWRGADEAGALGMSWTDDPVRAAWFAERPFHKSGPGVVWEVTIAPADGEVLARFEGGRNEREWVLDLEGWAVEHLTRLSPDEARARGAAAADLR